MEKTNERGTGGKREIGSPVPDTDTTDQLIKNHVDSILAVHTFISNVDYDRHRKKPDTQMSNAVTFLSQAHGELTRYLKGSLKMAKVKKVTELKKQSKVFFVRNLPDHVASQIREYAKEERTTLAGAVIKLVKMGEDQGFFDLK